MTITIQATEKVTQLNGVEVRLWDGITATGIPCKVFVQAVAVHREHDSTEFDIELKERLPLAVPVSLMGIL